MADSLNRADLLRSAAVGLSAGAMILVPTLGPLLAGTEEGAEAYDTEITPPDYAFAIWGPIFAASAANAIQQAIPANRVAATNRRSGWWLAGAYSANAAWSLAAQSGRFRWTPYLLPVATALAAQAYRRQQAEQPAGGQRIAPVATGLLLGWTSLASVVNAFAVQRGRLAPRTRAGRTAAGLALAGASVAVSAAVATSRRGHLALAGASLWGLATGALNRERTGPVRAAGAAAALLIATTTAARQLGSSRPPR